MRARFAGSLVVALAVVGVSSAQAQVVGLPVYNSGVGTGIKLSGEVGFPNEAAGKGKAFGASGAIGLGPLGFTATVASYNPQGDGDNISSVGGTANLKVFGGPLVPLSVTLQAGAGYAKVGDVKNLHVPVGVGFALSIPNPALAIRPWIAPRVDFNRVSIDGGDSDTETNFGISAGVEFNFINGIGIHAAYDWVKNGDEKPGVLGLGLHYAIKVPGL